HILMHDLTTTHISILSLHDALPIYQIMHFNAILSEPKVLRQELRQELKTIKKNYSTPRLTAIETDVQELKYDSTVTVADEDVARSEEHTSELQSRFDLVCRLLLEKK